MFGTLLLALLALAAPQQPTPTPADLAAEVARAERVGRELSLNDRASSRATDTLAAKLGTLEDRGLGGFLALRESGEAGKALDSWMVFFTSDEHPARVLYRVRVPLGEHAPEIVETPEPLALPEEIRPLWAARQLAIEKGGPYSQPINPVVLRGRDVGGEGILVYLLAGTEQPDVAVFGRHVRVRLDASGTKIEELAPLTKGALEVPTKTPEGKPVVALTVSQVLTDYPTEGHVFANLAYGLPVGVGTQRGVWMITNGAITFLGPRKQPKATLQLSLRESGAAREGALQLWRVGIPAEPGYTEGDEYIGNFRAGAEGLAIPDLVPGRYRALCEAHAGSAPALEAFEVKAPSTELALEVVAPRGREVWIDLVDVHGAGFESAEWMPSGRSGTQRLPAWLHPRSKIEADGSTQTVGAGGGMVSNSSDRAWRKLKRGEHGFAIGPVLEDGSIYETSSGFQLRVPEHGTVFGDVRHDGHDERRFRMLLVEKGSLEGLFTLPGGSPVDLNYVRIETPLELDTQPRPAQWWLDVPVSISVTVPGYVRLEFVQHLRDGPVKPRTLEKKP